MTRSNFSLGVVALVVLAGPITPARADLIPWQYNWSRWPTQVTSDAPGTGYITLTDESLKTAVGDSDIVATNLRTFSTAPPTAPDTFTNKAYTLALYLRDSNSGTDGHLYFTGLLNGTVSAQNANVDNTFTGLTTQSLVLGGNRYIVTISTYTPPGVPGAENSGAIGATASVTVINLAQVPEPATITMLASAVGLWSLSRLRRRK